jgi:hypothetical protein
VRAVGKMEGQASKSSKDSLVNCCFRKALAISTIPED